jgi:hypothetical protein
MTSSAGSRLTAVQVSIERLGRLSGIFKLTHYRKEDTAPMAVGQWYNFHEVGCHPGNVGLTYLAAAKQSAICGARIAVSGEDCGQLPAPSAR